MSETDNCSGGGSNSAALCYDDEGEREQAGTQGQARTSTDSMDSTESTDKHGQARSDKHGQARTSMDKHGQHGQHGNRVYDLLA